MIVFSLFVTGIIIMVVKSSRLEQQLVTTGYYEKELRYQETIDAQKNSASLNEPVQAKFSNDVVTLIFPPEMKGKEIKADIHLYNPADERQDRRVKESTSDALIALKFDVVKSGKYYVKLSWHAGGQPFYDELQLMVP